MSSEAPAPTPLLAIVGNPNSGKTTIFNLLTGLRQKVANYPGVTVEKKIGECWSQHGKKLRLIDLPGAYSLNARSPDEAVLRDVLLGRQADTPRPDRVVIIADAANFERNLYLASQVLELGLPTVLVLNMMDVAEDRQWRIDVPRLSATLGIPVIPMQGTKGRGLLELKTAISREDLPLPLWHSAPLPDDIRAALVRTRDELAAAGAVHDKATLLEPLYLLSDHDPLHAGIKDALLAPIQKGRESLEAAHPGWEDQLAADRYAMIESLCRDVLVRPEHEAPSLTEKIDRWLLHPVIGVGAMVAFLFFLSWLIFTVAPGPMDWIDGRFSALGEWVSGIMPEGDLRDLLVEGVIAGVGGVVIFLPQIVILFFFIGIMEDTGYMSRLAFLLDRLMRVAGLNGKAFLPFLSSYACAIPGVMATRTIDSPKDRLVAIMVTPLASCSARLPVYFLLISVLMPDGVTTIAKAGILVSLYALGTLGAFFFAWALNKGILRGADAPMILEMPTYKMPAFRGIFIQLWQRAKAFLVRAGTIILGISILIWAASTYPKSQDLQDKTAAIEAEAAALEGKEDPASQEKLAEVAQRLADSKSEHLAQSFAGRAGHLIEPLIKPLGYDWKIGIGLIGSFAAREVFVNTMSVVYAVEEEDDTAPLRERIQKETRPDGRPVYTPLVCISLLVFYVFAMQCISTMAIVKKETGSWGWMWFQLAFMTGAAYVLALGVYQIGTALGH